MTADRDSATRYPGPPLPWKGWLSALVVAAILYWSAVGTEASFGKLFTGLPEAVRFLERMAPTTGNPWPMDYVPVILERLQETVKIALGATAIGALLALPFTLISTAPLAPNRLVYNFGRSMLNLVRTIPDLVLAFLLTVPFGIGPLAGLLALVVFSFGVIAKLLADTVETIDPLPLEAVAAAGGSRLQRGVYAVLPQVAPDLVAYTLYAFEINIRVAAVLGLVGAGGIGFLLKADIDLLRYGRVGMIVFVTFLVVFAIDSLSTWLRGKLV